MPRRTDYDGAWKDALDLYFPEFLALLFPEVHAGIDWRDGHRFLDKEFQQVEPNQGTGTRTVDKLVEVRLSDGDQALVLVHVEIQSQSDAAFAERMFIYHSRIFDQRHRPLASLGVLADNRPSWRPHQFAHTLWDCRLQFQFPIAKLLDFNARWNELEASRNPFAAFVQAHLKTQATGRDPKKRLGWKLTIIEKLYEKGYDRNDVVQLFRFVDWLMWLPQDLKEHFRAELAAIEEEKNMPYITSIERLARKEGREQGRIEGREQGRLEVARDHVLETLEIRFQHIPDSIREAVYATSSLDALRLLHRHAIQDASLEAFMGRLADIRSERDAP